MKNIIVILGTIVLGALIVTTMILGNSGLQGSAEDIKTEAGRVVDQVITETKGDVK